MITFTLFTAAQCHEIDLKTRIYYSVEHHSSTHHSSSYLKAGELSTDSPAASLKKTKKQKPDRQLSSSLVSIKSLFVSTSQ